MMIIKQIIKNVFFRILLINILAIILLLSTILISNFLLIQEAIFKYGSQHALIPNVDKLIIEKFVNDPAVEKNAICIINESFITDNGTIMYVGAFSDYNLPYIKIISGRFPTTENEIAFKQSAIYNIGNVNIGDKIVLQTNNFEIKEYIIVGITNDFLQTNSFYSSDKYTNPIIPDAICAYSEKNNLITINILIKYFLPLYNDENDNIINSTMFNGYIYNNDLDYNNNIDLLDSQSAYVFSFILLFICIISVLIIIEQSKNETCSSKMIKNIFILGILFILIIGGFNLSKIVNSNSVYTNSDFTLKKSFDIEEGFLNSPINYANDGLSKNEIQSIKSFDNILSLTATRRIRFNLIFEKNLSLKIFEKKDLNNISENDIEILKKYNYDFTKSDFYATDLCLLDNNVIEQLLDFQKNDNQSSNIKSNCLLVVKSKQSDFYNDMPIYFSQIIDGKKIDIYTKICDIIYINEDSIFNDLFNQKVNFIMSVDVLKNINVPYTDISIIQKHNYDLQHTFSYLLNIIKYSTNNTSLMLECRYKQEGSLLFHIVLQIILISIALLAVILNYITLKLKKMR